MDVEEVAERRQALNEAAYFEVLRAFLARGSNDAVVAMRLRKELNVSNLQHRTWLEELKASIAAGPQALAAARGPAGGSNGGGVSAGVAKASGKSRQPGAAKPGSGSRKPKAQQQAQQQLQMQQQLQLQQQQQQQMQMQQQHQQQQMQPVDRSMVGYKAQYFFERTQEWMEGVITDYQPPNIILSFKVGTPHMFQEAIKWEQSQKLRMVNETVDLAQLGLGR